MLRSEQSALSVDVMILDIAKPVVSARPGARKRTLSARHDVLPNALNATLDELEVKA